MPGEHVPRGEPQGWVARRMQDLRWLFSAVAKSDTDSGPALSLLHEGASCPQPRI